ncbi:hypothetical protein L6452_00822 [Arctium lappa]|uniref:Uncharacterized protein n=1 Tax=Arctium lappa TaxID=4217 RepID=A0ACB9FEJ3_ARCLA|nr:hypothetical protein L6452_00822 [Arctium lappa]
MAAVAAAVFRSFGGIGDIRNFRSSRGPDTEVVILDKVGMKRCCRNEVEGKESQILEGRQRGEEPVGSHDGISLGGVCMRCNL